jgi:hypothetical protein
MHQRRITQRLDGNFEYEDEYGNIWLLIPTGRPDMPFTITILNRA